MTAIGTTGREVTTGRWTAIGTIRSPHPEPQGTPIQASAAVGVRGSVEVFDEYAKGLADVAGFSHLILIYHFHIGSRTDLVVTPFLDRQTRGVFATRSPARPNRLGLSIVRLIGIEGRTLTIEDVDVVNGTPLLDIKPYVPAFDHREAAAVGWFAERLGAAQTTRADGRFADR